VAVNPVRTEVRFTNEARGHAGFVILGRGEPGPRGRDESGSRTASSAPTGVHRVWFSVVRRPAGFVVPESYPRTVTATRCTALFM
jgi:hypothetical protein